MRYLILGTLLVFIVISLGRETSEEIVEVSPTPKPIRPTPKEIPTMEVTELISLDTLKRYPSPTPLSTPTQRLGRVVNTGGDGVYVREVPNGNKRIAVYPEGALIEVISKEGSWYKVLSYNGVGYIPAQYFSGE